MIKVQVGGDDEFDWAAKYEPQLRALPLAAGGLGIAGVLLNRLFSGVRVYYLSSKCTISPGVT